MRCLVVLTAALVTLANAKGAIDLQAHLGNSQGDNVDVVLTWVPENCVSEKPTFRIFYKGRDNVEYESGFTESARFTIGDMEFWSNYSIRLHTNCIGEHDNLTTAIYTGPGNPRPVSSVQVRPTTMNAKVTIFEAEKMPRIPDEYTLFVCTADNSVCFTDVVARNGIFAQTSIDYTIKDLAPSTQYIMQVKAVIAFETKKYESLAYLAQFDTGDAL